MSDTKFAPRTATEAVKSAKSMVGQYRYTGMCQAFTVTRFGLGGLGDRDGDGDADAIDGWVSAQAKVPVSKIKNYKDIPPGVMLYWSGGSRGYGHAAVSIGGGKMVTTDYRNGQIGIANIQGWWANSHRFLGYVTVEANGHVLRDPIREPLMRVGTYNVKLNGNEARYFNKVKRRMILMAITITSLKYDILAMQERPNVHGKYLDKRIDIRTKRKKNPSKIRRVFGDFGRYTYTGNRIKDEWGKSLTPEAKKNGRDKPYTVSEHIAPNGRRFLFVNGHPEPGSNSESIKVREDQCEEIIREVKLLAKKKGVDFRRTIWAGDWQGRQMRDMLVKHGFYDAFRVAKKVKKKNIRSFNGGKVKPIKGARIDYICLDPDEWDVQSATQLWLRRSDHNPQVVNIYHTR